MKRNHTEIPHPQGASILHKSMRIAAVAVAILVCTISVVVFFNLPLNLSPFKKNIENFAREALGMGVAIEGDCHLIPGRRPAVEMQGLRLRQPDYQGDLLRLEYLKVGVEIFPLLKRKLRVTEIIAQGLGLELRNSDGSRSRPVDGAEMPEGRGQPSEIHLKKPPTWLVEVTRIDLHDASITFGSPQATHTVVFSDIVGSATDRDGLKLSVRGAYRNIPWEMAVDGGSPITLQTSTSSWPLRLSASGAGADLMLKGRLHPAERKASLDLRLSGSADPRLESLLGEVIAGFDDYALAFHLDVADSRLHLTALKGRLDNTRFTGDGQWDGVGKRLTGAVNAAVLDLGPVIRAAYPADGPEPQPGTGINADRDKPFSLPAVASKLDIDLRFAVDQIVGIPGELRSATARLITTDGRLRLPVSLNVLGTTVGGEAALTREENTLNFSVDVTADRTDLGRLTDDLFGRKGVAGKLDGLSFSAAATGTDLPKLLNNLEARLDVRNADFSVDDPSPIEPMRVVLKAATVTLPAGAVMKGAVTGHLIGKPFTLNVTGGSMRDILEKSRWPVDLRFSGSGAKLHLTGTLTPLGDTFGPELSLRLSGDRIGALATWTGISPSAAMSYFLKADVSLRHNRWDLDVHNLILGKTTLRGAVGAESLANRQPRTAVSINADLVDARQLKTLFLLPDYGDRPAQASERQELTGEDFARILDTMVFPKELHLPEMAVNLDIRRLLTDKLTYDRCSLKASFQRDRTTESRFQFDLGEASFGGEAFLDLVRQPPALGLRFSTSRFELGQLLDALGVAKGVDARARTFEINVTTRGRRLADLIRQREISARVQDGRWVLKDAHTAVAISLDSANFADRPGEPFRLDLRGHIQDSPLKIRWEIKKKHPEEASSAGRAYQFEAEVAGARLVLTGHLVFPLGRRGVAHQLTINGDWLNNLEPLLNVSLPPLGPYEASGVIRILPEGYSLSNAVVSIGDSRFLGQFQIVTEGPRQKVEANLQAKTIQLLDFDVVYRASTSDEKRPTVAERQTDHSVNMERRRQLRQLIDPSADSTMDADISIEVAEVFAGANRLGSGTLRIVRGENRLSISPLALSFPGGEVNCALELMDTGGGVNGTLKAETHQLDYGPLLRLKYPNTMSSGRVSMVIDLESSADSIDTLLTEADGRVAVSIQPENIGAGGLDFWATNLLSAVLPVLNPDNESKINCIVADLTMAGGIMQEKAIVVDTSKIRVQARAHVDFKKQTVYLKLIPRPKRPQFLSLATPLEVSGKFSDFRVGLAPGSLVGTTIRFLTAHIVVPFQWIILNKLPKDGSDVCPDAINKHYP